MKKLFVITLALGFILAISSLGWAQCNTIKDGVIVDTNGNQIKTGYDKWGYNYQAHIFNGLYWNSSRPEIPWTKETLIAAGKSTTILVMKWSDTWLSNKDCNLDGKLDRGYPCNPDNPTIDTCINNVLYCGQEVSNETIRKPRNTGTPPIPSYGSVGRWTPAC